MFITNPIIEKSLLQLDTIDILTTTTLSQSPRLSSFQLDLNDLTNIENDLSESCPMINRFEVNENF